jgi:hypothetical protein
MNQILDFAPFFVTRPHVETILRDREEIRTWQPGVAAEAGKTKKN